MKPYSSSSEKENCSPLSSNCVEWQGPFIECINICKGDSVSDIVYKLSEKVCNIEGGTTINDVNLTCILNACDNIKAPDGTLGSILQTIVDGVCCSVASLNQQTSQLQARTANLYNEPTLVLPTNFQYVEPTTGLPVAKLPLSEFASNTATNTSTLKTVVETHTVQISNQEMRVQSLETNPGYIPPTVTPLCTYGGLAFAGIPTEMNILLTAVEADYCNYKIGIGSTIDLINATNAQCAFLASSNALSQTGTMSGIAGWNLNVGNIAQSMQNLWLTVCDMRNAVNTIKQNITPDCSQFLLGFTSTTNTLRTTVTLIFNGLTVIPSGFDNCPTFSTISITDGTNTYTDTLDLMTYATDPAGITYNISGAGLNAALPYTITVTGCIVKDGTTCSKQVVNGNTPTTTTTTAALNRQYTVVIDSGDIAKATGNTDTNLDGKVFVSFVNSSSNPVVNEYTSATGTTICVLAGTTPVLYYYESDAVQATALREFINTSLNISVTAGDYIEMKLVTPNPYVTPPAGITFGGTVYIQ